jgi:DNA-binding MarR family transcriptional regulator
LGLATPQRAGFSIFMSRTVPSRLAKKDYELLAEFRYALRKFFRFSEAAAAGHGVTPQQYQVLLAIEGFRGRDWVTIGELAEQMQLAHHSAVGLVDRMEALRLVRRTVSKVDRRRVHVSVTARGSKILERLYRAHREELKSVGPRLVALLNGANAAGSERAEGASTVG